MKKLLCMLLCLMLLIPAAAFAAQGDVTMSTTSGQLEQYGVENGFRSFCAAGDTLYMLTYDGKLLTHKVGDAEPKVYTSDMNQESGADETYSYYTHANYYMFSANDKVYVLKSVTQYNGETGTESVTSASMNELTFSGDHAALNALFDVNMESMRTSEGYMPYLQYLVGAGDYLVMYSDDGSSASAGVWAMSLTDGSMKRIDVAPAGNYLMSLALYKDNTVLTQIWENNGQSVGFYAIDPAAGTSAQVSSVPVESYESFSGIATDQATGTVYCVKGGEIRTLDVMTGEVGEGITDIVADNGNGFILTGGFYAAADYQSYSLRNINPGQQSNRKMKISSSSWGNNIDAAYYTFANAHGDVSVVYSHDYSEYENLIQDMMNRDSSIDVYILSTSNSTFSALYQRGYLADFSDSEKLMQLANAIQPELLEQLSVNGRFSVLPVSGYFYLPFMNRAALEKAGISTEEIPTNWADFLEWLPTLAGRLPDGMSLLDPWTSASDARMSIFYQIFQCYQNHLENDPNSVSANDMVSILEALDRVDFSALGQPSDEQIRSDNYSPEWNEEGILMELNSGRSISGMATKYYPLVMSLKNGLPHMLTMDAAVAIINPFSKNVDLALQFLETLADKMEDETAYTIRTDKTEPTPNKWYEQNMQEMQKYVDQLKKQIETAEAVNKQQLEETLKQAETAMKEMESDRWSISEADIAWMSEHRAELGLAGDNWLYSDNTGDGATLIQQYLDGQIDASRLMKEVDRKVRMRIMEGA